MGILKLKFYFYMFLYPIKQVILSGGFKICSIILSVHCHWTCKNFEQKKGKQFNAFPLKILYASCTIVYFVKLIEGCVKYPPTINWFTISNEVVTNPSVIVLKLFLFFPLKSIPIIL